MCSSDLEAQEFANTRNSVLNQQADNYCIFFAWNIGTELYKKVKKIGLQNLKVLSFYPTFSQEEIA